MLLKLIKLLWKKIKNLCSENEINVFFTFLGIILILFARLPYGYEWGENILDGIGCSCVAAAVMAICMNQMQYRKDKIKIDSMRKLYYRAYYNRIVEMVQRILWFDERWEDEKFNWGLNPQEYGSLRYLIFSHEKYKSDEKICFSDLEKKMQICSEKYSFENISKMNDEELKKVHAMVNIVLHNSMDVIAEEKKMKSDKLVLSELTRVELEKLDSISRNTAMAFQILCSEGKKAYGVSYNMIFKNLVILREICGFEDDFVIALQGTIRLGEL